MLRFLRFRSKTASSAVTGITKKIHKKTHKKAIKERKKPQRATRKLFLVN